MTGQFFLLLLFLQGSAATNSFGKRPLENSNIVNLPDEKRPNIDIQVNANKPELKVTGDEVVTIHKIFAKIGDNPDGSPKYSTTPLHQFNDIQMQEYLKQVPSEGVFKHVVQMTETTYKSATLDRDIELDTTKYEATHLSVENTDNIYSQVTNADIADKPIEKGVVAAIIDRKLQDMKRVKERMGKRPDHTVAILSAAENQDFKTLVNGVTNEINSNKGDYTLEQKKIVVSREVQVLNNGQLSTLSKPELSTKYELELKNIKTGVTGIALNTAETNQIFHLTKTSQTGANAVEQKSYFVSRTPEKAVMQASIHAGSNKELLNTGSKTISLGLHHIGAVEPGTSNQVNFAAVPDDSGKQMSVGPSDSKCRPRRRRDELHGVHRARRSSCTFRRKLTTQEPTRAKKARVENKQASYQTSEESSFAKRRSSTGGLNLDTADGSSKNPSRISKVVSSQDSLLKGQLLTDIGTGKVNPKGLRVGAVAFKSGYYKLKTLSTRLSNTKFVQRFGTFSSAANYAFLIKNFANALRHGDVTSIAVIGGMVGTGVVSQLLITRGKELGISSLKTFGKVLGAGLDVIGVAFDIESVVNSHKCLDTHTQNKELCVRGEQGCLEEYSVCGGRNAVAEVVSSYFQLGLGLVSAGVSLAFPPAAPFIAVFNLLFSFALSTYQATEQVDSFAKYFPLTHAEKEGQVWRVIFGSGIEQRFLNLREQSKANGLLLNSMGEFLEKNKEQFWAFLGPASEVFDRSRNVGKTPWGVGDAVGCAFLWALCIKTDQYQTYYDFEEYADNKVDLTDYAFRFFERWSPNPNEMIENYKPYKFNDYNFFCRPWGFDSGTGAPFLKGYSYKCVNALGYRSQEPSEKLFAYFDLKAGDDKAVGYASSPNYFVVGGGKKDFEGGQLDDIFILGDDTPSDVTTGVLKGGNGNDTLQMNPSFNSKTEVEVLVENNDQFVSTKKGKITLKSIENIIGREGVADHIVASCQNRYIDGKGGNQEWTDVIEIAKFRCRDNFAQEVTINVPPSTRVTNYNKNPLVKYAYNIAKPENGRIWKRIVAIENLPEGLTASTHTIQFGYTVVEINQCRAVYTDTSGRVKLAIQTTGGQNIEALFQLNLNDPNVHLGLENNAEIVLIQNSQSSTSTNSQMELDAVFRIILSTSQSSVYGHPMYSNVFVLNSRETDFIELVQGGSSNLRSNTFIFLQNSKIGTLDAKNGPENTIEFHKGVTGTVFLDLYGRTLSFNGGKTQTILAGKFQRIQSRTSGTLRLTTDCHLHSLDTKSKTEGGDQIIIPEISCPNQKLQIRVYDTTHVTSRPIAGQYSYFIENDGTVEKRAHLTIFSARSSTAQHHVVTEYSATDFQTLSFDSLGNVLRAATSNLNLVVHLEEPLGMDPNSPKFVLLLKEQAQIILTRSRDEQRGTQGGHPSDKVVATPAFQFDLNHVKEKTVTGGTNNPNIFLIQTSSNHEIDLIQGGHKSDTFLFTAKSKVKRIEAGISGENLIQLADGLHGHVTMDMTAGEIEFHGFNYQTSIRGMCQHFLGRYNVADSFVANCYTESIDLRNGHTNQLDTILIPLQDCTKLPSSVKIQVCPFTNVTNERPGVFVYGIPRANELEPNSNSVKNGGERTINIRGSTNSTHLIQLEHLPHEFTTLTFDPTGLKYNIRASDLHLEITISNLDTAKNIFLVCSQDVEVDLEVGATYELSFRWNLTSVPGTQIIGGRNHRNRFLIQSNYDRIRGGGLKDVFVFRPNAHVRTLEGAGGEDVLVFIGYGEDTAKLLADEILFFKENQNFPFKTKLVGSFPYVHVTGFGLTLVPDPCTTKLIDVSDPESYSVIKIEKISLESNCAFDDLTIKLSSNPESYLILNEAQNGLFRYEVPLPHGNRSEFVIFNERPKNGSEHFQQIFRLPHGIFELSNIEALPENSSVVIETSDGSLLTFRIVLVGDDEPEPPFFSMANDTDYDATTAWNNVPRALLVFPFNFLTTDNYEVTVNHVGGLHSVTKVKSDPENPNQVFDLIADHTDLCNQLGMTLLIPLLDDEREPEKIIQIGGDDEMDFLINQASTESHLVGNSMGSQNTFYITPTLNNTPIYVYLVEAYRDESEFFSSEYDEDLDDLDPNESQRNIISLLSFYDQRPEDVDPMEYVPNIIIPTVEENGGDLIVTALYDKTGATTEETNSTMENRTLEKQTIVFVDGVSSFNRMFVKLYSILYEFKQDSPPLNGSQQNGTVWNLSPRKFSFEAQFNNDDDDQPIDNLGDSSVQEESSTGNNRTNLRSDRQKRQINESLTSTNTVSTKEKSSPDEHVTLIAYGDIMEYQMADVPLEISDMENFGLDKSLYSSSGDNLVITNDLEKPGLKSYLGFTSSDSEATQKTSVVLVGIKRLMEENNFTITLTKMEDGKTEQMVISSANFTEILVDLNRAEKDLESYVWWVQIAVIVVGTLLALINCVILYKSIRFCCDRYRVKKEGYNPLSQEPEGVNKKSKTQIE